MALIHEKSSRGRTQTGWLDSFHTFSFGGFNDPVRVGHRSLRVINEDRVIPGAGFGEHSHADMEIITYVISGALAHRDSLGNGSTIHVGDVQRMSAGTGITHSEMNASDTEPVHFLQIWILPDRDGVEPSYEQKAIDTAKATNRFHVIAGAGGGMDAVHLHRNVSVLLARMDDGVTATHEFAPGRAGFLQIVNGMVTVDGETLSAGDGLQFTGRDICTVGALTDCEVLLFDLD